MFKELNELFGSMGLKAVGFAIVQEGDMLKLTVSPLGKGEKVVRNFQATDTPENLDAQFAELLKQYAEVKPEAGNNIAEIRKAAGIDKKPKATKPEEKKAPVVKKDGPKASETPKPEAPKAEIPAVAPAVTVPTTDSSLELDFN